MGAWSWCWADGYFKGGADSGDDGCEMVTCGNMGGRRHDDFTEFRKLWKSLRVVGEEAVDYLLMTLLKLGNRKSL